MILSRQFLEEDLPEGDKGIGRRLEDGFGFGAADDPIDERGARHTGPPSQNPGTFGVLASDVISRPPYASCCASVQPE